MNLATVATADQQRKAHFAAPIPIAELERRWSKLRAAMSAQGMDCLVLQATNNLFGGYFRYLTDMAVGDVYANTLIFPLHGEMTIINSGPTETREVSEWMWPGAREMHTGPYFPSVHYTYGEDGRRAAGIIGAAQHRTVGIVASGEMFASFERELRSSLPDVRFVEATDLVDVIKAPKSNDELQFLEDTVQLQDDSFAEVLDLIRPGMRAFELRAELQRSVTLRGSEEQLIMIGVGPLDTAVYQKGIRDQYREIQKGDAVCLMLECNGPGGVWAEIGRTFCLGEPPAPLRGAWADACELQDFTAEMLIPGADPATVFEAYNAELTRRGYPPERRGFCHSQGYDVYERPNLDEREHLTLTANMNFALHPTLFMPNAFAFCCDNFVTREAGPARRLHQTPRELFVI